MYSNVAACQLKLPHLTANSVSANCIKITNMLPTNNSIFKTNYILMYKSI